MFAHILNWRVVILLYIVFAIIYVHNRGKARFKFLRQLTDHSSFMAPFNVILYFTSKVPNQPYLDVKAFPELAEFKKNWQVIRKEALKLKELGYIRASNRYDDVGFNSFFKRGWKRFYLKWYNEGSHPSAKEVCPKTLALIAKVPYIKAAMFTYLPAGAKLGKHRDPYAGSLRYHLGIDTPNSDDCVIFVDDEPYSWRDGEDVLFDETFMHYAENKTDQDRLIFFCDVERPLKYRWATAYNRWFSNTFMAAAASPNFDTDRTGVINKIFKYPFLLHKKIHQIKKWNKIVYYILKYAFILLVIYLIFFFR